MWGADEWRPCDRHRKQQDRQRGSAASRGYGRRWSNARDLYIRQHPLCVACLAEHVVYGGEDKRNPLNVDHKIPKHPDDPAFWDESNWQTLCRRHHSEKTAKFDGGLGNRMAQ